jgi:hypothetical protein
MHYSSPHAYYMPCPYYLPWFNHFNCIWRANRISHKYLYVNGIWTRDCASRGLKLQITLVQFMKNYNVFLWIYIPSCFGLRRAVCSSETLWA